MESERESIVSFSGAHPFRPSCLADLGMVMDEVAEITLAVDAGDCPRCGASLPENCLAAGSRMTRCRCVPVCGECGTDEARLEAVGSGEIVETQEPTLVEIPVGNLVDRPHPGGALEFGFDDSVDIAELAG